MAHKIVDVINAINNEGFEYAFIHYADYSDVPQEEFQEKYRAYMKAHRELKEYLEEFGDIS